LQESQVSEFVETHGLEELMAALLEAAEQFNATVMLNLRNLGNMTIFLCKAEVADVRYTGRFEDSFVSEEDSQKLQVLIFPMAPHRMFIRMGTRPHWAPAGPLKAWAAVKLGDPKLGYAVQRRIAGVVEGKPGGTSLHQMVKRGTMTNPWPKRVVARADFQRALAFTSERLGIDIVERIAG
jgi:uncharacterized protein YejL (UPF0352 family)